MRRSPGRRYQTLSSGTDLRFLDIGEFRDEALRSSSTLILQRSQAGSGAAA